MRNRLLALIVVALAGIACAGCFGLLSFDYFVDAALGDDANPGTEAEPLRTISAALAVAVAGEAIKVAPGVYDTGLGESFPLDLPEGVTLVGDEDAKGEGVAVTHIDGGGAAVVVLPDVDCVVAGFKISSGVVPDTTVGIDVVSSGVELRNNTITENGAHGVRVRSGASDLVLTGNRIVDNGDSDTTGTGVAFEGGGANSRVEDNVITGNGIGVATDTAGVDLGGGASFSNGGNTISCNGSNDVAVAGALAISAENGFWDDVPPSSEGEGDGSDVFTDDEAGSVDSGGAALAAATCPFYDLYVDGVNGDDGNDGSQASPFETITAALAAATAEDVVQVAPDVYDSAHGESFPIFVPADVTLRGDPATRGVGPPATAIAGGGQIPGTSLSAAVQLGDDAALVGFRVTNQGGPASFDNGVSIGFPAPPGTGGGASVRSSSIVDSDYAGIDVRNVGAVEVEDTLVENNFIGIYFVDGGADSVISDSEVVDNFSKGVLFLAPGGGLNGESVTVSPGNVLSCNGVDLDATFGGTVSVDASDNDWDHSPPQKSTTPGNFDVVTGTATVTTSSSAVAAGHCP